MRRNIPHLALLAMLAMHVALKITKKDTFPRMGYLTTVVRISQATSQLYFTTSGSKKMIEIEKEKSRTS